MRRQADTEAMATGVVVKWDDAGGYGTIRSDDGQDLFFHCTALVDGTRTTSVGTTVTFEVVPGRLGRWEAAEIAQSQNPDQARFDTST